MNELSMLDILLGASLVVQAVMGLLFLVSLFSWYLVFRKWSELRRWRQADARFEAHFWQQKSQEKLFRRIRLGKDPAQGMAALFVSGHEELMRQQDQLLTGGKAVADNLGRVMRVVVQREIDRLESGLSFLATAGSTSPYIGLFGTVWGVMHAFHSLGDAKQATLSMVAPGISEALIATAMGLFVAIPAVIAYNRFSYESDRIANRMEGFVDEYVAAKAHTLNGNA